MKVHHLNCATSRPRPAGFVFGRRAPFPHMVCHCLLVELPDMLVLIDSGFGVADMHDAKRRIGAGVVRLLRPDLRESECAIRQVERMGFEAKDVQHIVLTHLDMDHVGGITDFPHARIHVLETEFQRAMLRETIIERERYRPVYWRHSPRWVKHTADGEPWFGFETVRQLDGLPPEILMIPLIGHSLGHCGIAVQANERWLLHCGDAYFHRKEMDAQHPRCSPGLAAFQSTVQMHGKLRHQNQRRLRELARDHGSEVEVFCAHDPVEFYRYTSPGS